MNINNIKPVTTNYPTDQTDAQYEAILQIMGDNRKRKYTLRSIWNAILYLHKTGCHRHMLPHDCPQWQAVYYYLNKWTYDGTVEQVNDQLRERTSP
jgi:transposase